MKRQRWIALEAMLQRHGFIKSFVEDEQLRTIWFSAKSTEGNNLSINFRFAFKSKVEVLTMHVGWTQPDTRQFVHRALEKSWPSGLEWISETGLLHTPAMLLFNLAESMKWVLAGMSVRGDDFEFERQISVLNSLLEIQNFRAENPELLLNRYLADISPFRWRNSNSAIRIAEVAGLVCFLKFGSDRFDVAVKEWLTLINSDMFGLGDALTWTDALRSLVKHPPPT